MEILPGEGVAAAKVGESREVVEARLGAPVHPGREDKAIYETVPMLILTYAEDDTVEVVEIGYTGDGGEEVFFDGVQLTYRFMADVVADLAARGYAHEPIDVGYRFEPGFALFSMGARTARDLDPSASADDEREIVEGVSVAPYDYFREPTDEEFEEYFRGIEERYG
ncbi:hypothetical protein [Actinoplanes subtropicus]|uniref:hypothetical protein n=1 Tax=Actinoplanes subtropicus TaxID=543632 RepID=UPI000551EA8A|nr:hypothetical protein [Actinoplanes subtropicus]